MTSRRGRIARLAAAVILALPALVALPSVSSADTEAELAAARAQFDQLNRDMEVLVEEYNGARVRLEGLRTQHAEILSMKEDAESDEAAAIRALTDRAHAAYMDSGSQLDVLLGAGNFADFSDRLEFINQLAEQDSDLAAQAESAAQRAAWAAAELKDAEIEQAQLVAELANKRQAIEASVEHQQALVDQLGQQLAAEQEAARRAALRAAAQEENGGQGGSGRDAEAAPTTGGGGSGDGGSGGTGGGGTPPPVGSGAQAAVAAAYSVLGTRYVWGGASPSGFDCSGLTMWAWARGGVSLPHHSGSQYAATPRVSRSQLQPGDLVFFYSPISHVGLYIGGNRMIDAIHPGPSGKVAVRTLFSGYVGAGRPG